jgi:hypothetical protein
MDFHKEEGKTLIRMETFMMGTGTWESPMAKELEPTQMEVHM